MTARDATSESTTAALLELGSATLGESGGLTFPSRLRPVWRGAKVAAPAFPVRCSPGDNLAVHVAVATSPPGHVLVVDVGGLAERGYWGEVLTTAAESRGVVGLVIDGCVRDSDALEAHGFPVFSAGVALPGASKVESGTAGTAVEVAGVLVEPGDWIVGDADGVVSIPAARLTDVLAAGRARADKEARLFEALRAGSTTLELLALDASPVRVDAGGVGSG